MGIKLPLVLLLLLKLYANFTSANNNFEIIYEWSTLAFDFPTEEASNLSIENGVFKEGLLQPIDVQPVHYNLPKKHGVLLLITIPRSRDGIPATLGTVTKKQIKGNPIIAPYPNWEWHTDPEMCKEQRIVSVYRVFVDCCNRLWVLDNGRIGDIQVCTPQILAFDLKTDKVLRQYSIPFNQHTNTSLYVTPMVEVESLSNNCENTFVYNADAQAPSLLVYNFKDNKSWRIFDKTFYPYPSYGTYNINGVSFEMMDGIMGLALSPAGSKRKLFYHALSSQTENWVYTEHLKNESLFSVAFGTPKIFQTYRKGRKTQSAAEAMDNAGNLYFGLIGDIKIASWNIKYPYNLHNFAIIGNNKETMQFPSGMKITLDENGDEILWIFATAFQKLATNTLLLNETNFRILFGKIKDFLPIL